MRVFFTVVLPLITPSLLYLGWLMLRARGVPSTGGASPAPGDRADGTESGNGQDGAPPPRGWGDSMPWATLVVSGALLAVAATTTLYLTQPSGKPGDVFVPPHMEDGRIVPGHFAPQGVNPGH